MPKIDRRDFLKLMGVASGAAATAACSDPTEKLIPYVIQPEEITPGIPVVYASTCQECPAGCGLHVKTREGRPIKLDGNPDHPVNRGKLCSRGQVALGWTYHPDRWDGPRSSSGALSWDEGISSLATLIQSAGKGEIAILGGDPGTTAGKQLDQFAQTVGAERVVYAPLDEEALRSACSQVFGATGRPHFDLSDTDLIVSLGGDFLESGTHHIAHARNWAAARDIEDPSKHAARFVYFGPRLSLTAGNADEWIPAKPGSEGALALALARVAWEAGARPAADAEEVGALLTQVSLSDAAKVSGVEATEISRVGKALARSRNGVVMPPGAGFASRRAVSTHSAVLLLNYLIGSIGQQVRILPLPDAHPNRREGYKALLKLTAAIAEGKIQLLLINDANPIYAYPGFAQALEKAKAAGNAPKIVCFSSLQDETSSIADLVLPNHTPLESWGDREVCPGVRSVQQPTFRPIKDTRPTVDALWAAAKQAGFPAPELDFRGLLMAAWASAGDFHDILKAGGVFSEDASSMEVRLSADLSKLDGKAPLIVGDGEQYAYLLVPVPSPMLADGSGANLPWLQEIADPVTKLTWQSYVEISKNTARKLSVTHGDIVEVSTPAGSADVPVYVRGGIMDDLIAIPTGQGHTVGTWASEDGKARGINVFDLIPAEMTDEDGGRAWLTVKAALAPTDSAPRPSAFIIKSDNKRGRDLGDTIELSALTAPHDEHAGAGGHHGAIKEFDPIYDSDRNSPYRWGMAIDLDKCTGCSACIAACYTENAIPVVGERETVRGRNMDWLRLERWIGDGDTHSPNVVTDRKVENRWGNEELGNNDVRHSPMTCQHCGAAPCEQVCPVIGTYHNAEGLNVMVYNRCVGTRYCANNCSYKVRKYNFWDYSHEYWPGDLALMLNPDITVRGRGVMEKCTFCIQRIQEARQPAKDEGRVIRSNEVQMACQQTCPTEAISFGNLKEAGSAVAKLTGTKGRGYYALHELNARPAITYLKKVKRGQVKG